jgi:hypothetical protein
LSRIYRHSAKAIQNRNFRHMNRLVAAAAPAALAKTAPDRPHSRGASDKHGVRTLGKFGVVICHG